jgi:secreted PhoX family phosphatase
MPIAPFSRARVYEQSEDVGRNPSDNPTIGDVIAARFDRRDVIRGALGVAAIAATVGPLALAASHAARANSATRFPFKEVEAGVDVNHHVADGYNADVLIRWGDPVLQGAPAFDPAKQSAAAQKRQFGYNNDFLGYFPMPGAADPSRSGLLVVNHEYTIEELMFPGLRRQDNRGVAFAEMTKDLVDIEMAAHGGAVIEIRRDGETWHVVAGSKYSRRIDADTPMEITGPAAGHPRLQTAADPSGRRVHGMLNNCAGGVTPWGTWLTCEENFNGYFWGKLADDHPEAKNYRRIGVPANAYAWGKWYDRFDVTKEPNEANRFGWIVEIDPFDPNATPKKRTALGRNKHEGAAGIVNKDGRYVVYSGDDERNDYVYRFVTARRVDAANAAANRDILDAGTLSVARYNADGTVDWLPLVVGQGPLTAANGFDSQADVLIETRRAADLVGATKMDRPEDVDANPLTQKVYVILTNNQGRSEKDVDAANPRAGNKFGHIIEMIPPDGDHAVPQFKWEILLRCGDPSVAAIGATFSSETTRNGWFGMPDNCAIDSDGRLWIATDGNSDQATGRSDGLWTLETEGEARATSKLFFRCPAGAELCGPAFTPDSETLFVAVQHPGDDGEQWKAFARPSTFDDPSTRWPDFKPGMPPRPSVVVITKKGGGKIGT